jgi:PBP1b-binding outer membrane lipoprotein LpoB
MKSLSVRFLFLFFFLSLIGCSSVADYNQLAYDQTLSLKSEAVNLISKANENYIDHQSEIDSLKQNVQHAYLYSKTIPNNDETISQWEIIRDPNRNSLFGLLERWRIKTQLSETFISQVKILIASDFNALIDYENNKRKPLNN